MSHIALYREWRPQTFSEVVAQKQVVYPLKQSIINGDIGHAYLFSGTRGTGKTSVAKIFAKAVNCLQPQSGDPCNECDICIAIDNGSLLDVMEIDAASNNSVDNIRRITDEIVFMPSQAKYKVYIIDEVHMLSGGAFNALLKTLEEPPAHAIFILATTEPHRIPATVISRCQRFDFRRIGQEEIIKRLATIAAKNQINIDDTAISTIAQLADGALRDAISLLDQAQSGIDMPISRERLFDMVGIVQDQFLILLVSALLESDLKKVLDLINEMVMSGRDLERFVTEFAQFLRNLLVSKITGNTDEWFGISNKDLKLVMDLANRTSKNLLLSWIEDISKLASDLKYSGNPRIAIEVGLIKLINQNTNTALLIQNQDLESSATIESTPKSKVVDLSPEILAEDKAEKIFEPEKEKKVEFEKEFPQITSEKLETNQDEQSNKSASGSMPLVEKWQAILAYLQEKQRVDLKMLLSPAKVTQNGNKWEISFNKKLRSHYKALTQSENKALIEKAIQKISSEKKIELLIKLKNDEENVENNLNPDEPAWIKEVRQMAEDLKIPIIMED